MALLAPRRRVFDETLPDGRSVYEGVRDLSRRPRETPDMQQPPKPPPTIERRVALPVATPEAATDLAPEPSRDFTSRGPTLADMPVPPTMIQRNNKGRPVAIIGGDDPIQNNLELIRAQEGYKAPRSTKDQILSLLQGGIPGAIDYATNQKTRNRWAVGEDIADEEGQIGRELGLRKTQNEFNRAGLQDDLIRSQIDENKAQAEGARTRASQPPKSDSKFIERGDGVYEISGQFPEGRKVGNIPAEAKSRTSATHYFERPDGVYGVNDEHPEGFKISGVPGTPEKPDTSGFSNDLINKNISDAAAEQAKVEQALRDTAPTVKEPGYDVSGQPIMVDKPNPVYTNLERRRDALIDDQRRWRAGMKPPTARGSRGGGPAPTTHGFSISGWLAKNPGKTEADAKAFHDGDPKYRAFQIIP